MYVGTVKLYINILKYRYIKKYFQYYVMIYHIYVYDHDVQINHARVEYSYSKSVVLHIYFDF